MRSAVRRAIAALLLAAAIPTRGAGAQSLPGDHPVDRESDYLAHVRAGVDSTFRRWQQAVDARDAAGLARLYSPTATLVPRAGSAIHGRPALGDAFANALPRMSAVHFVVERMTASGDLATVAAELTYQVPFPSGGSYERRERVQLALRPRWNQGWLIEMQSGGDLPPTLAWVRPPRGVLRPGEADTVTVRVTDALGGGIPDVLMAFGGDGAGLFAPAGVTTDARGEATAVRVAGTEASVGELRVTPAIEPHEALLSLVRTVLPGDSTVAGATAAGGIPRP
jgi:uncharacterized protein (TIGR02246 family)